MNGGFYHVDCWRTYCHPDLRADRQEIRGTSGIIFSRSFDVPDRGPAGGRHEGIHESNGQQFAGADNLYRHGFLVCHAPDGM